ncbi:MAG TPA: metalloregulator ArsR/SmtB family transcription factor [Acidimicrobiia bacterium]
MSESTSPLERVRTLTTAPRRIPIEVEGNVSHEVILTIWAVFSPKDTHSAADLGPEWIEEVRAKTPDDLAAELISLGGPWFYVWLSISAFLLSAPHPHDPDHVFNWLESIDEQRLRRWILGHTCHSTDQALIEQAATGDIDAVVELVSPNGDEEESAEANEMVEYARQVLFSDGLPERFARVIKRFREEVFTEYEDEFAGAISRAAAARRAAPARGSAKEVVEEVTSGIDFEIPIGITRVVLVPSVITRPLSLVDSARGTLVVYYGIADEFVDSDPEAPPSWLVRMYKALSDDKRLRILRRLSEGETSLDELTEMLGLSKSTVHHHLSQLRGAGLVRVRIPSDESKSKQKHYTLREQSLSDAGAFLDSYLRTGDLEEQHA